MTEGGCRRDQARRANLPADASGPSRLGTARGGPTFESMPCAISRTALVQGDRSSVMARRPARKSAANPPRAAAAQRPRSPRQRQRSRENHRGISGAAGREADRADRPCRNRRRSRRVACAIARRILLAARDPRRPYQGRRPRGAGGGFQRHGGGAGARTAVRRADAPARSSGAASRSGAFAVALGHPQSAAGFRAQRARRALAAMDADRRRHRAPPARAA